MMRIVAFFCFFFYNSCNLYAQHLAGGDAYEYTFDFNKCNKNQLEIILLAPTVDRDTLEFVFDAANVVLFVHAFDIFGKKLKVIKNNNSTFTIYNAKLLFKIKYTIKCNWENEDYLLFEPQKYIGQFTKTIEYPITLFFKNKKKWEGVTALSTPSIQHHIQAFRYSKYKSMLQEPIVFCKPNSSIKTIRNQKYLVTVASANTNVSATDICELLERYLDPTSINLKNDSTLLHLVFIPNATTEKYEVISVTSRFEIYKISQIYVSKSIDAWAKNRTQMELDNSINAAINTRNDAALEWFKQGAISYLKFKTDLAAQPNKKLYFENWLQRSLQQSMWYEDTVALCRYAKKYPEQRYINKARGVLLAFCFDIATATASSNHRDFNQFLEYFKRKYDGRPVSFFEVNYDIVKATENTALADLLWGSVEGKNAFNFKPFIEALGLLVEINTTASAIGIGNFNYTTQSQSASIDNVIIKKIDSDYLTSLVGLKQNDAIKNINGQEVNVANFFKVLSKIEELKLNTRVPLQVERSINNTKTRITVFATTSYFKPKYDVKITTSKNPTEQQSAICNMLFGF